MPTDFQPVHGHPVSLPAGADPRGFVLRLVTDVGAVLDSRAAGRDDVRQVVREMHDLGARWAVDNIDRWAMVVIYCGDCGETVAAIRIAAGLA